MDIRFRRYDGDEAGPTTVGINRHDRPVTAMMLAEGYGVASATSRFCMQIRVCPGGSHSIRPTS
jgi:hypothetical protein